MSEKGSGDKRREVKLCWKPKLSKNFIILIRKLNNKAEI